MANKEMNALIEMQRAALEKIASETTLGEPFKSENRIMSRDEMIAVARAALPGDEVNNRMVENAIADGEAQLAVRRFARQSAERLFSKLGSPFGFDRNMRDEDERLIAEALEAVLVERNKFAMHCHSLIAEIEYLQEATGETLDDEDADMVRQISAEASVIAPLTSAALPSSPPTE